MRLLIAISSCQSYEDSGWNDPLRQTWLKDAVELGIDYKFFHGNGAIPKNDVYVLSCHDAYFDLTSKTKLKAQWAYERGYDYMFACFPDTYACAERLLMCGFDKFDYFGDLYDHVNGEYCQGGAGYFLSRKACQVIAEEKRNFPNEDAYVGHILREHSEISRGDHRGFAYVPNPPRKENNIVSCHLSTAVGGYKPQLMFDMHRAWLESNALPVPTFNLPTGEAPKQSDPPQQETWVWNLPHGRPLRRLRKP